MSLREMYILFRGSRTCCVVIRSEIFHHSRTLFLFPQPQHALLEKGSDMCNDWKEAHDAAMEELKEKITSAPVLVCEDSEFEVKLFTNASSKEIGAVIQLKGEGGGRIGEVPPPCFLSVIRSLFLNKAARLLNTNVAFIPESGTVFWFDTTTD